MPGRGVSPAPGARLRPPYLGGGTQSVPSGTEGLELAQSRRVTAERGGHRHGQSNRLLNHLGGVELVLAPVLTLGAVGLGPHPVDEHALHLELALLQVLQAGSPTRASLEDTQQALFGIFTVTWENQDRLLDLARKFAPTSLDMPDIVAIHFHRSLDGLEVINLCVWTSIDHFAFLKQKLGFKDNSVYWQGVADLQFDFFDVVAVESTPCADSLRQSISGKSFFCFYLKSW